MHIHYNTNQTTLPLELACILPQDHIVFTIEKVVNTLEERHFHAFYHNFGRPSYHPKMLLAALLFAYSQGIFSGRKIEKMMIENLAMQYLTGHSWLSAIVPSIVFVSLKGWKTSFVIFSLTSIFV